MPTYLADFVAATKTKLEGIDELKGVYDYAPTKIASFPFAIISGQGWDESEVSQTFIRRIYHISVFLFQEISEVGFMSKKAARVFRKVQDAIMTAFDSDITLGGTCLLVTPVRGEAPAVVDTPIRGLMMKINLDFHKEIERSI